MSTPDSDSSKAFRLVVSLSAWLLLMVAFTLYYFWQWLGTAHPVAFPEQRYVVQKGDTLHSVAREMQTAKLVRWPKVWVAYARFMDLANVRSGEYQLDEFESPISLLNKLEQGEFVQRKITFVEGRSFREYLQILASHPHVGQGAGTLNPAVVMKELSGDGVNIDHPEGWFFPDTYYFSSGVSAMSILRRANKKMRGVLSEEWAGRSENLPYDNVYEALIMASIVEKETGVPEERKQIAGVFVRRLQKRMRLQTDPTVIYGMGEEYDGNIRRRDLKTPTPYNTYVIKGLPPTPIAMPGREAINAALHPEKGTSLYFVAKGDGSHQFSDSLEQHREAVRRYQKQRRSNYRSSPLPKTPSSADSSREGANNAR